MSSAKRTPRYVETIPPLRIVGPTVEAQVIPIRRITPAYVPVIDAPLAPVPAKRRSKAFVPVARRPWRVLVVSPLPGAATRTFDVARWQAKLAAFVLIALLLMSGGAVAAVVVTVQSPDLFVTSADAALLRAQLEDMEDSLALVRAELMTARTSTADSGAITASSSILTPGRSTRPPAPVRPARRTFASRVKTADREDASSVASAPRSLEGLPVIGRLASVFSRSRRHPILHIRRPHLGVDLAAPRGTEITAPAAGKVIFVGRRFGYGLVVEIQHTAEVKTRYAHLKAAKVNVGDAVTKGLQIGTVGSSGITTGPHLHYEVLVNGRQVDPLRFRLPQPVDGALIPVPPVLPDSLAAPTGSGDPIFPDGSQDSVMLRRSSSRP